METYDNTCLVSRKEKYSILDNEKICKMKRRENKK
jgi:hypothetical protein